MSIEFHWAKSIIIYHWTKVTSLSFFFSTLAPFNKFDSEHDLTFQRVFDFSFWPHTFIESISLFPEYRINFFLSGNLLITNKRKHIYKYKLQQVDCERFGRFAVGVLFLCFVQSSVSWVVYFSLVYRSQSITITIGPPFLLFT